MRKLALNDGAAALRKRDRRTDAGTHRGRESAFMQVTDVLLAVLAERDADLYRHMHGIGQLAEVTAKELGLPADEATRIAHAAQLHDIGKLALPDAILRKSGELTESEWNAVRQHTVIGERIAAACAALEAVAPLIRSAHERWDGNGYPDGLAGAAIPLGARIIFVCDAFDAMTSPRSYRQAMSDAYAVTELRRCAGSQFDAQVVAAFTHAYERTRAPAPSVMILHAADRAGSGTAPQAEHRTRRAQAR